MDVTFFEESIDEVFVVEAVIDDIATEDARRMQVRKEFKSAAIVGVDVGVADLATERIVRDEQVDAEDVISGFREILLLGVVLTVVFLERVLEGGLDVHDLNDNSHLIFVIVCIESKVTFGDKLLQREFVQLLAAENRAFQLGTLDLSHLGLTGNKSVPFLGVVRLHPGLDFKEVSVVISCEAAKLVFPLGIGDTSDLINSRFDATSVVELIIFLLIGEADLEVTGHLNTLNHSKDNIKVRRALLLGFSLLLPSFLFEQQWHFVALEVIPAELAQLDECGKDASVFIIKSDLLVDGAVVVEIGLAVEDPEIGVLNLISLLGLKSAIVDLNAEPVNEQDVSNLDIEGEVVLAVAVEENLHGCVWTRGVDDLELLGEVSIVLVSEHIGAVDDQANCGIVPVVGFLAALGITLALLKELAQGPQLSIFAHFCYFCYTQNGRDSGYKF